MRILEAKLITNSHLYFYSTEFLKTTTVDRILHNWALMFALNNINANPKKQHLENLEEIEFYCTPAMPINIETESFLLNPVPEDTEGGKLGIMRVEKFRPNSQFKFLVMSRSGKLPPHIISYGKKKTSHRVEYKDIGRAEFKEKIKMRVKDFINPLDFKKIEEIQQAKKHPMRPSPLYKVYGCFHDIFVLPQRNAVFPANFPYLSDKL